MSVKRIGKIKIDIDRAADIAVALIVGAVLDRTQAGLDIDGNAFAPYSPGYAAQLVRAGRIAVPTLRQTGSLLGSLGERRRDTSGGTLTVHIGPGVEIGPAYSIGSKGLRRRGLRGITNAQLGHIHHEGLGRVPRRRWLSVKKELAAIVKRVLSTPGLLRA